MRKRELFIIIQSKTSSMINGAGTSTVWQIYKGPEESKAVEITRERAMQLIEENEMARMPVEMRDGDRIVRGAVYELPGCPFKKKYDGWFTKQAEKQRIAFEKRMAQLQKSNPRIKGRPITTGTLVGMKFGRAVAVKPTEKRTNGGGVMWECKCDCGTTFYASRNSLLRGNTSSCGCLRRELAQNKINEKNKRERDGNQG